jgi:hypothetical protein
MVTNTYGWAEAYASDGQHVSEWFEGPISNKTVDVLAADGAHLKAALESTGASGTVQIGSGAVLTFTITQVTRPAGLYRVKQQVGEVVYLGGWVLLPDGQQVGVIETSAQHNLPAPRLDPAHPTIHLPDGAVLVPQLETPESSFSDEPASAHPGNSSPVSSGPLPRRPAYQPGSLNLRKSLEFLPGVKRDGTSVCMVSSR